MSSIEGMINDCKDVYLCTPALKVYGVLNGIRRETANLEQYAKDFWEFSVTVDKYIQIDGKPVESNNYDDIKIHMYLFIDGIGYFKLEEPRIVNDGNSEYKEIVAYGCDVEFEERDWINLKINTGDKDSLEQLADGNLNDLGYAKQFVTLYNTKNRQLSLIDNILDRMQGWTVGHVDYILRAKTIPRIDVPNASFYSILTSKVAPKLDCIFVFDILNRTINAYHKDSIDFETNIFIGFRNLAKEVNIEVSEDSVFTRIKVRGDDELDFRNINFGSDQIWDLSYFMSEPWMDQDLVDKLDSYLAYRESQRDSYVDLEVQAAKITDKLYEVNYRVPSDQTYSKNWTSINEEGLVENLKLYTAQLEAIQMSVDTRPDSQKYENYTDIANRKYKPYTNSQGEVDHERYLELLRNADSSGYGGYYTYKEIVDYILPNIQVAMMNRNMPDDQKYTYENGKLYVASGKLATTSGTLILSSDGANSDVDWELYGIVELEAVKSSYVNDRLPALNKFSEPWSSMSDEEQMQYVNEAGYNMMGRDEYLKLQSRLGDKYTPGTINYRLNELYQTRDSLQSQLDGLTAQMNTIKQSVALENDGQSWSFTDEELKTINALFVDTDYTNTNILSTSIDTTVTKLDKQRELYRDAVDKLSSLSQPQYTFEVELDNLIRIPEFQDWAEDLQLLRYVRLGIRDDYSVKLRIIGIRYNPCGVDEDLSLKFSSMITSKSGRNDFTELIENENNRAAKNSITLGMGNATNETEYLTSMLQLLSRSGAFSGLVRSLAGGSIRDTVKNYMSGSSVPVTSLSGSMEDFSSLFLTGLDADTIISILVNSANGQFEKLEAKLLEADTGKFEQLFSKYLSSEVIVTNILSASEADIDKLIAKLVVVHEMTVDELKALLIQVDTLEAESAFVKYLQTVSSTTATSVVNKEYVKDLVANYVSVADLAAGNITLSDAMQIVSEGGKLVMNGSALQIKGTDKDGNEFTAIQLGYDTTENPSFIINSEDGSAVFTSTGINIQDKNGTVLFSAGSGITANAIADSLIVDKMIQDETISENKLNFTVWKKDDQITIQDIYTEPGTTFGTEWTNYKNSVEDQLAATITSIQTNYYSSTSRTSMQDGEWTMDASSLDYSPGHYIWQKTVTTYSNGEILESDAIMISGNDGIQGEHGFPGQDGTGKTLYFHVKYSPVSNPTTSSQLLETPSTYIGTYVDYTLENSTDPSKYTWTRFEGIKGEQGIPSATAEDGITRYLHVKYSNDGGATFTANVGEDAGQYIGTLVDENPTDSTLPSDYSWAKIQGRSIANIIQMYYKSPTSNRINIPNPPANEATNLSVNTGILNVSSGRLSVHLDGWSTEVPVWSAGMYVWVCSRITYDDGTVEYTEPYCDSSWAAANKVQEGLNNLQGDLLDAKMELISSISGVRFIADNNNMSINNKVWKTDISATVNSMNVGGVNLFDPNLFYSYINGTLNKSVNIIKSGASYSVTANPNLYIGFLLDTSNLETIAGRQQIIVDGYFTRTDTATDAYTGVVVKYQCYSETGAKIYGEQTINLTFSVRDGNPISNRFSTIIDVPSETKSIRIGIGQAYSKPYTISYLTIKDAGIYDITSNIRDRLVEQTMDLDGIHTTIFDMESTIGNEETEGTILKRLATQETTASEFRTEITKISTDLGTTTTMAQQTADQFKWFVKSGTSASEVEFTDTYITLISNAINLTGKVTFNSFDTDTKTALETASGWVDDNSVSFENTEKMLTNWAYGEAISETTTIDGGLIQTNTIEAEKINVETLSSITANVGTLTAGTIESTDYNYTSGLFTNAGLIIDLTNGIFRSKNMLIEAGETGDAYFNGILVAKELFVGMDYGDVVSGVTGSYICYKDDKLLINTPGLTVTEDSASFSGSLNAATGSFKGELSAATGSFTGKVTAKDGEIGGWTITSTSLYRGNASYGQNGNGNIYLGADGFSLSSKFGYNTSDGSLTISADTIKIFTGTEDYSDISGLISGAAETASKYLTFDETNGLCIYRNTGTTNTFNIQLDGSYVKFRNGTSVYASYGATTTFYKPNTTNKVMELSSSGIDFYQVGSSSKAMTLTSDGINLTSGSININDRFIVSDQGSLTLKSDTSSSYGYCELTMTSSGLGLRGYTSADVEKQLLDLDLKRGLMLETNGYLDTSLSSKVGVVYYYSSSYPYRHYSVYLIADDDGAGVYYWEQSYMTRGFSLIRADTSGNVHIGDKYNVEIGGKINNSTNKLAIGGNLELEKHLYLENNKNIYGGFITGIQGAKSNFTGSYLNLMSLNTKNNLHIGAENKSDCEGLRCAEAIYLNAVNVYAGSSGTVITVSDRNHKKDIENFTNAKEFIMQLSPKKFKFNNGTSNRYHSGFIAQEVKEAMDNTTGDFGVYCEVDLYETGDKDKYVSMLRYDEIIAPHVALTQEHEHRIQELENEISELKEQIKLLLGGNG